jgi:tRNA threonylcarbamoyl adenosine modification protein YjeE
MAFSFPLTLSLADPEATSALAVAVAPLLAAGDTLLLAGQIGAGKTHFARALIQARLAKAGKFEDVPSPTYTLVQTYSDDEVDIWHADLYRLTSAHEVTELGLDDAMTNAICLIEWPDRLGLETPDALSLTFHPTHAGGSRNIVIDGNAERWQKLGKVFDDFAAH